MHITLGTCRINRMPKDPSLLGRNQSVQVLIGGVEDEEQEKNDEKGEEHAVRCRCMWAEVDGRSNLSGCLGPLVKILSLA